MYIFLIEVILKSFWLIWSIFEGYYESSLLAMIDF